MLLTMIRFWQIFSRKFCKKKPYSIPSSITLNNLTPVDKREYLKGTISLGHCIGHICITSVFYFDGFYDNHRRLFSKTFFKNKNNELSIFSKNYEQKIKIFDCTLPGHDFNYLLPQRTITLNIDRKYNIPLFDIRFDGWYENNVCLRPKHTKQKDHFLLLQRTPLQTPSVSSLSSDDSGFDTVF